MSILDAELTTLDALDKKYHDLYTQKDGKWLLTGVKGYTPEDRENISNTLKKERKSASDAVNALKPYKTLFGDKKPEDIQAELDTIDDLKLAANGKPSEAEIEARVNARLESAKKPLQRQLEQANEKTAKAEGRIKSYETAEERSLIRSEIQKAALASAALPKSYADGGGLLAVLESELTVEVTVDADGVRTLGKVTTKDGKDVAAAIKAAQTSHDYFWAPSKGGGANAGGPGGPAPGVNPFKAGPTFNRSHQMKLLTDNPTLAAQMKSAAESA